MKKIYLTLAICLLCISYSHAKKAKEPDYDIISVKMNRCEIIDTMAIDSMIQKSQEIHEKYTSHNANNITFGLINESDSYCVTSLLSYCMDILFTFESAVRCCNGIIDAYGYAYFKGKILLVTMGKNFPSKLFKRTDEWNYVMFLLDYSKECNDIPSECLFDSNCNFIKSSYLDDM